MNLKFRSGAPWAPERLLYAPVCGAPHVARRRLFAPLPTAFRPLAAPHSQGGNSMLNMQYPYQSPLT